MNTMKHYWHYVLAFTVAFSAFVRATAQEEQGNTAEPSVEQAVAKAMEGAANESGCISKEFIEKYGAEQLVPHLGAYAGDPNSKVRGEANRALYGVARLAKDAKVTQSVVEALLPYVDEGTVLWLVDFRPSDYSKDARAYIHKTMQSLRPEDATGRERLNLYVLLAGAAHMRTELPFLAEIIETSTEELSSGETSLNHSLWWNAVRASARMGVEEHISMALAAVQAIEPKSDRRLKYKEIAYVRQPEIVNFLKEDLYSDDSPPSGGSDTVTLSYAHYAASALSQMLEGFPKKSFYEPEDIAVCRRWMAERKEWHFK